VQELGGLNLYRFVANMPTRGVDAYGLKWWSWVPVFNLLTCFLPEEGEDMGDFASIPPPSCAECKADPEAAEQKCEDAVRVKALGYSSQAFGPLILDIVEDAAIVGIGFFAPPIWLALIPNGIATGCELKAMANIRDAADQYKEKSCKCLRPKNERQPSNAK
jgi:hypothetical protein